MSQTKLLVEDVFVTEGIPEFTFIRPPNFQEILLDIRRDGKSVIIEGQSGTGKTTCVLRVLAELNDAQRAEYLTARDASHVSRIEAIVRDNLGGRFVIDDFHRLASELQESLANIAKSASELGTSVNRPKLIIIGINQVGSDLIQLVPDIAKRVGIHRIKPGSCEDITRLIEAGCERLNIKINDAVKVFEESRGDFWLTQQLCQSACLNASITETAEETTSIKFDLDNVRERVVERLRAAFYPVVKELCRGKRFRPSNDPYFKLLRAIGGQDSSIVDLNGLANSTPEVRGSINNIKDHRLAILIGSKPLLSRHFYYNEETKTFVIEDPAMFYFIHHLNWDQLRQDCGFREQGDEYLYEIAISFAGENRELARFIAQNLEKLDVTVFFDEQFEANFLGKAWTKEFAKIFGEKSKYVVCLLDHHHEKKIWPTFEREHFAPRIAEESVIPIYLDDTKFVGIPHDIVGIRFRFDPESPDWPTRAIDEIVIKLIDKLD